MYRVTKRGFTLVELLVVIAIISVLIALLLPTLRGALTKARSISCMNNMAQINSFANIYAGDYNGRVPHGVGRKSTFSDNSFRWGEIHLLIALGYLDREAVPVYYCPNQQSLKPPANPGSLHYVVQSYDGRGYVRDGDTKGIVMRPAKLGECANDGLWSIGHFMARGAYTDYSTFSQSPAGLTDGYNLAYYSGKVVHVNDPAGAKYVYDAYFHVYYWAQYWGVVMYGYAFDEQTTEWSKDPKTCYDTWMGGDVYGKIGWYINYGDLNHKDSSIWPTR